MTYTVRAQRNAEIVSQTRLQPSSAIVLAVRWAEEGYQSVTIQYGGGQSLAVRTTQDQWLRELQL